MFFHWLFITGTLVLCAVAAMPTRGWLHIGERMKTQRLRRTQTQLEQALAAQQRPFTPGESFLDRGVGLAIDHAQGLVFLATPDKAGMRADILPASALGTHSARTKLDNGFQEHFVEIGAPGTTRPAWRLSCPDTALAVEVDLALSRLQGGPRPA